jgi:hypothetical protein
MHTIDRVVEDLDQREDSKDNIGEFNEIVSMIKPDFIRNTI